MKSIFKGTLLLAYILLFIKFIFMASIACGVAWIIGLIFNISINYFIPIGIIAGIYVLVNVYIFIQGLLMKKVVNKIDEEFDTGFFK
ncbi:hypothetical protein [Bacillus weihaiensis]|uniref:hypothetical protein n=1 Tax=Bacillus weihaiensis TaxID=1547283 RepID=UPI002357A698|nr:hypothetical protein [Bacillus weihaiensis]